MAVERWNEKNRKVVEQDPNGVERRRPPDEGFLQEGRAMTPFQEFRLWARRAPAGERAAAAITSVIVLSLLIWVLIPNSSKNGNSTLTFGNGAQPGNSAAPGTGGSSTGTGAGGAGGAVGGPGGTVGGANGATGTNGGSFNGSTGGTTTTQTSGGCKSPPASGTG